MALTDNQDLVRDYHARLAAGEQRADIIESLALIRGVRPKTIANLLSVLLPMKAPDVAPPPDEYVQPPSFIEKFSQLGEYHQRINRLGKRFVRVMHFADVHYPYHDPLAVQCAIEVAELYHPDICVTGSDQEDFPEISHWRADGKQYLQEIGGEQFLETQSESRHYLANAIRAAAPDAILVNIEGNHGWPRFSTWVNKNASNVKNLLFKQYIENIRDAGILWIGALESTLITNDLLVTHYGATSVHSAYGTLARRRFSVNILAGHTHRPDYYTVTLTGGRSASCWVSGCLATLPEPYINASEDHYSPHQHGIAYATIDTLTHQVHMGHVTFTRTQTNEMAFIWGGEPVGVSL